MRIHVRKNINVTVSSSATEKNYTNDTFKPRWKEGRLDDVAAIMIIISDKDGRSTDMCRC